MPIWVLFFMFVVTAVAGFIGYTLGLRATTAGDAPTASTDAEGFIEHLRELTWQHRDLAPELSTILLDEIAQRHRRELG